MEAIGGFFGRVLLLPFRAIAYTFNPDNWDNTFSDISEDAINVSKEVVDGKPRGISKRVYVKMSQFSADMGVSVKLVRHGVVALSLRRSGKLEKMKREELDKLQRESLGMALNNVVVRIDIDILEIRKCFHTENAVVNEISRRIEVDLKALSEAIDIYKIHGDSKLVNNIARVLYHSDECEPVELSIKDADGMVIIIANKGALAH